MKPPRVSIAGLMVLVIVVAANFAAARAFAFAATRALGYRSHYGLRIYWAWFGPFVFTLLFALVPLARSRGRARTFWGGFLILGSMALASLLNYALDEEPGYLVDRLWGGYDTLTCDNLKRPILRSMWVPRCASPGEIAAWAQIAVVLFLPQSAIALAGGLVARSIASVAARRRWSVGGVDGEGGPERPATS